jgi:hypothetical protein
MLYAGRPAHERKKIGKIMRMVRTCTPIGPQNPMVSAPEATWLWIPGLGDDLNPLFRCSHGLAEQIRLRELEEKRLETRILRDGALMELLEVKMLKGAELRD